MTTSPERSGAAPWYCSHESSRAAASTMVAAGLVAAAALLAFVGLLVAGDEVSALVAAMVMLVAGANTWAARRSRTWWRGAPTAGRAPRSRPTPAATTPAPPDRPARLPGAQRSTRPAGAAARRSTRPAAAQRSELPFAGAVAPTTRTAPEAPAPRTAPRARLDASAVPAAVPAPAGGRPPAVVPLVVVPAAVAREPEARADAADTVVLDRGPRRSRCAIRETPASVSVEAVAPSDEIPEARAGSPRPGRATSASAARTRRRTAPVRPVARHVAGTRSS
jgi:hypothetical protein